MSSIYKNSLTEVPWELYDPNSLSAARIAGTTIGDFQNEVIADNDPAFTLVPLSPLNLPGTRPLKRLNQNFFRSGTAANRIFIIRRQSILLDNSFGFYSNVAGSHIIFLECDFLLINPTQNSSGSNSYWPTRQITITSNSFNSGTSSLNRPKELSQLSTDITISAIGCNFSVYTNTLFDIRAVVSVLDNCRFSEISTDSRGNVRLLYFYTQPGGYVRNSNIEGLQNTRGQTVAIRTIWVIGSDLENINTNGFTLAVPDTERSIITDQQVAEGGLIVQFHSGFSLSNNNGSGGFFSVAPQFTLDDEATSDRINWLSGAAGRVAWMQRQSFVVGYRFKPTFYETLSQRADRIKAQITYGFSYGTATQWHTLAAHAGRVLNYETGASGFLEGDYVPHLDVSNGISGGNIFIPTALYLPENIPTGANSHANTAPPVKFTSEIVVRGFFHNISDDQTWTASFQTTNDQENVSGSISYTIDNLIRKNLFYTGETKKTDAQINTHFSSLTEISPHDLYDYAKFNWSNFNEIDLPTIRSGRVLLGNTNISLSNSFSFTAQTSTNAALIEIPALTQSPNVDKIGCNLFDSNNVKIVADLQCLMISNLRLDPSFLSDTDRGANLSFDGSLFTIENGVPVTIQIDRPVSGRSFLPLRFTNADELHFFWSDETADNEGEVMLLFLGSVPQNITQVDGFINEPQPQIQPVELVLSGIPESVRVRAYDFTNSTITESNTASHLFDSNDEDNITNPDGSLIFKGSQPALNSTVYTGRFIAGLGTTVTRLIFIATCPIHRTRIYFSNLDTTQTLQGETPTRTTISFANISNEASVISSLRTNESAATISFPTQADIQGRFIPIFSITGFSYSVSSQYPASGQQTNALFAFSRSSPLYNQAIYNSLARNFIGIPQLGNEIQYNWDILNFPNNSESQGAAGFLTLDGGNTIERLSFFYITNDDAQQSLLQPTLAELQANINEHTIAVRRVFDHATKDSDNNATVVSTERLLNASILTAQANQINSSILEIPTLAQINNLLDALSTTENVTDSKQEILDALPVVPEDLSTAENITTAKQEILDALPVVPEDLATLSNLTDSTQVILEALPVVPEDLATLSNLTDSTQVILEALPVVPEDLATSDNVTDAKQEILDAIPEAPNFPTQNEIITAIFDKTLSTNVTFEMLIRRISAVLTGRVEVTNNGLTNQFYDYEGNLAVTATVTNEGERTNIEFTPPASA